MPGDSVPGSHNMKQRRSSAHTDIFSNKISLRKLSKNKGGTLGFGSGKPLLIWKLIALPHLLFFID